MVAQQQQICHCDSRAELEVAAEGQGLAKMEAAVQQLLVGVGEDPTREGLIDTPRRVAKAWLDMTRGYRQECKSAFGTALFHEPIVASGADGLVVVRDITFAALSEATLLPFHGRCHIAYVPRQGVVLGLSKLARVTKCLAARLQTQQQFTERLIAAVQEEVQPLGVAAVVQAVHLGAGPAPAAHTSTATCGCFADPASGHLQEFMALLRLSSTVLSSTALATFQSVADPAAVVEAQQQQLGPASSAMAAAADTLLQCVGENPTRKGLKGGAVRYASWLHSATAGYRMQLPGNCQSPALEAVAGLQLPAGATSASAGANGTAELPLGPPTPDDHSPDPSDASSDDMSADIPWYMAMRETAVPHILQASVVPPHGTQGPCPASPQHQQQQGEALSGLQTFSAQFSSQCEHHLLPFYGRLKLAYLPAPGSGSDGGGTPSSSSSSDAGSDGSGSNGESGASTAVLQHIVQMYSRRLQVQERLTHQVADAVVAALGTPAVLVVVESAHMCMVARGVEKHASTTLTTAARGSWANDVAARAAALEALLEAQPHTHLQ